MTCQWRDEVLVFLVEFVMTAAIWRSSNSVKRRPLALCGADERANMSLSTAFREAVGDDFEPSRSSTNSVRAGWSSWRSANSDRQAQVGDAGHEVVVKTGERARKDIGVVGADARRQLARDRREGA